MDVPYFKDGPLDPINIWLILVMHTSFIGPMKGRMQVWFIPSLVTFLNY
jgi:hypothetical protein